MAKSISDVFDEYRESGLRRQYKFDCACNENKDFAAFLPKIRAARATELKAQVLGTEPSGELARLEVEQSKIISEQIKQKRYSCELCKDSGRTAHGLCGCLLNEIYQKCYGAQSIEKLNGSFEKFDLSKFDNTIMLPGDRTQQKLISLYLNQAKKYVSELPNPIRKNILMIGKAGLGKSYIMECIAKAARARGIDVLYIRAAELFATFLKHRLGENIELSYIKKADLLLIDDLGTEPVTQNVSIEYLYNLIDSRLTANKNTVFATNVSNLQSRYDDRIASRLESKIDCIMMYFQGKDIRMQNE